MLYILTPTTPVIEYLDSLNQGLHPREAAKQAGLSIPEGNLIRKMAGLPVARYAPDLIDKVISLRATGMTYRDIALNAGCSQSYVNHILHQHRHH